MGIKLFGERSIAIIGLVKEDEQVAKDPMPGKSFFLFQFHTTIKLRKRSKGQ